MESIETVYARLHERGYTEQCRAEKDGIHFLSAGLVCRPEDLQVDEVVRLEGTSSPDEQVAIFALSSADGQHHGTFCVTHGPETDPIDSDMMQRLTLKTELGPSEADDVLQMQF